MFTAVFAVCAVSLSYIIFLFPIWYYTSRYLPLIYIIYIVLLYLMTGGGNLLHVCNFVCVRRQRSPQAISGYNTRHIQESTAGGIARTFIMKPGIWLCYTKSQAHLTNDIIRVFRRSRRLTVINILFYDLSFSFYSSRRIYFYTRRRETDGNRCR